MPPYFERKELWCGGEAYEKHRIPGMLVTDKGTLLAYNEARRTAEDWAMMDILCQRSTDAGKSFADFFPLACGTEALPTVNNPVMMQDTRGRIHFLYCECYGTRGGRVLRRYSDDDGLTWSDAIDITPFTAPAERTCFALGPGHGITLADGTLLVPVWLVPRIYGQPVRKHGPSVVTTLTSRDNGESWSLGEWIWTTAEVVSPNETAAAELADGRVYLNLRSEASYRSRAYSCNGATAWQGLAPDYALTDARCFGSLTTVRDENGKQILLFANCTNVDARDHVTVHASRDGGLHWFAHKLVDECRGGYAEINAESAERIYLLYEEDYGAKCHLCTFHLDWLLS